MSRRDPRRIRAAAVLLLGALLTAALAGCLGGVSQEERDALESRGRSMASAFFGAKGGEVVSTGAFEVFLPGQPSHSHLSEYVTGEYRDADGVWTYYLNTETEEVFTSKGWEEAREERERWALRRLTEELGLPEEETQLRDYWVLGTLLPHAPAAKEDLFYPECWCVKALPFGVEDLTDWLEDAAGREPIPVARCRAVAPEGTDLSRYSLTSLFPAGGGIEVSQVTVETAEASFTAAGRSASYLEWREAEGEGYILRYTAFSRREERDGAGNVTCREATLDPRDIVLERTETGYALRFPQTEDRALKVQLLVREGAEMAAHSYTLQFLNRDTAVEVGWTPGDSGLLTLAMGHVPVTFEVYHDDADLVIRDGP